MLSNKTLLRALVIAGLVAPTTAFATDGYFSHAYGLKASSMGGAGIAVALEPFGGAVNPGAMSFLGNDWQVGISWFSPDREASRTGSGPANIDGSVTSGSKNFYIPELGVNYMIRPDIAIGISVYGNGGMNTDYSGGQIPSQSACAQFNPKPGPYNLMCGNDSLGVNLEQLMVAPYVSWQFVKGHSVGVAPVLAYQTFEAKGLQAFDNPGLSSSPGNVTNRGKDSATGIGVRLGYMGQINDMFSVGVSWASKISMGEFSDYKGLFAEQGGFDIPETWTLGFAVQPTKQWLIAVDYQQIKYGGVKSIANASSLIGYCFMGMRDNCLGANNGAGFGWQDVDVWKIGVQYMIDDRWTFRAGYNHSDNPISPADVTFNILAPGVVQDHYTLGASYKLDKDSEIFGTFWYADRNSVTGTSLLVGFGAPPTTTETISMKETTIGFGYSRRF
jgi:long-chain fatty acid transport protein